MLIETVEILALDIVVYLFFVFCYLGFIVIHSI